MSITRRKINITNFDSCLLIYDKGVTKYALTYKLNYVKE